MKITADTNILVRALTDDDPLQSPRAQAELAQAELVAIPSAALCELVGVVAMVDAGGEFADGVIAHGGAWLGDATFISFDRPAIALLQAQGHPSRLC